MERQVVAEGPEQKESQNLPAPQISDAPAAGVEGIKVEFGPEKKVEKPAEEPQVRVSFADRDTRFSKLVKGHYLKNNFFFFVASLCAILAGSKTHSVVLIFMVLALRTVELAGVYFGFLWASYIADALVAITNYINILTALMHYT